MKELQNLLQKQIGEQLEQYGFKARPADQSFIRQIDGGRQSCHVAFITHSQDFDVTADVAIRIDALEEMVNASNKHLPKKLKANTYSIGCELGNLVHGEQHRWCVESADDLENVANSVADYFIQYALPYFEKYSNLTEAFNLIALHPETPSIHAPFLDRRAKMAVGLAILLGKRNELSTLVHEYEKQLSIIYPHGLQGFKEFVEQVRDQ